MFIWVFTVIVYVFFVYGVIEFFKSLYQDFYRREKFKGHEIEILVNDIEELEYTIRTLKKDFNHIVLLMKGNAGDIEGFEKMVEELSGDLDIEYRLVENFGGVEKSL